MNSREYWQKRYLQLKASSERTAVQYERKMLQQMDTINTQISQMIVAWYKRYARTAGIDFATAAQELKRARGKDWETTLDDFIRKAKLDGYEDELDLQYIQQQVARLQQLQSQIMNQVAPVVPELTDSMSEQLQQTYLDTYEHATYLNEGITGMQGNFANYDETAVKMAVSNPWGDGQMFSKRIWDNFQNQLPKMLTDAVMRGTVLGENSKKISKRIAAANNTFSEVNIHRLVQSELAHVTEEATFKSYADTGVEEYTYMATLESHTCPICGDLDLQRFKLSDKKSGVNYPTIHPYCRCTTAAWNEDMPPIGKRWSKNPETGKRKMVDAVSFNEWAKQNGLRKSPTKPKSLVNANTAEKLGAKTAADIDATLRNAPKNMQHLWSKFANQMVIDDDADNPTLGSHYNNRTGKVTLRPKDIEGANGRNRLDAYFHEMAHLIDNKAGNVSVNEDFKNALNSDYDNFMNPRINRFRNDVTKDSDKLVTYGRKSYYDTLEVKFGKNGKLTPSSARMLTQNEVRDELRTKYSKSSLGDVSDMTGASSGIEGGLFGTGHKKNYYWTPGNQEKEAFAEMTSATINNPESLELIKKIYPTAYKKYQQIVDQVNHNSKSGAVSGALNDDNDPFLEKRSKYADDTYEMLRKAKRESLVEVSAQRSGISVEAAQRGLQHILDSKYDLWDNGRLVHFDPSYDMSESLIRLRMHNG